MPVRSVVLVNIGPPFGGFRLAVHPGVFGLNDSSAFEALEDAIKTCHATLRPRLPSTWHELPDAMFEPHIQGRQASIDITGDVTDTDAGDLVVRARLPFQAWPFGGWVVHEGWHRAADGSWSPFTDGELARVW